MSENKGNERTATQTGRVVGTPAYMSPEQAHGKETDHRTDIWSFGCIMYQMLTGRLPFEGQTAADTLARIIEHQPDWEALPEEIPTSIRALVQHCLEKDPDRRPGDIVEAITEITKTLSLSPATLPRKLTKTTMIVGAVVIVVLSFPGVWFTLNKQTKPFSKEIRLVVLPFENIGPNSDDWFADGITSEITNRLANIHGLAVISQQSAMQYKNKEVNTPQIARELDVDYILEGTFECERPLDPNSEMRIRMQLVRTADDTLLWPQSYSGDMQKLRWLQSDIAEKVAQALDITLLEPKRQALEFDTTEDTEAYICYLRGNEYFGRLSEDDQRTAIEMYEKAIELDPNLAPAYKQLSNAHTHVYYYYGRDKDHLLWAKEAIDKALELDPDLPSAHVALARYYFQGHRDCDNALEHLKIVQESYPNHRSMLHWTGVIQAYQGDLEQALVNKKRSFQLNPLDGSKAASIAGTLQDLRKYSEANDYYDKAILRRPERPYYYVNKAHLYLVWQGNTDMAREILDEAMRKIGKDKNEYVAEIYHAGAVIDIYDRKYEEALKKLSLEVRYFGNAPFTPHIEINLRRAEVYGYRDEKELEQQYYESAIVALKGRLLEDPNNARYHSRLGRAYAGLGGREQDAIDEGLLGVEGLPIDRDAVAGSSRFEDLARIYVMVGEHDRAIEQLEYLLSKPSELSIHLLRLDPAWEPLHGHPRFQKLIEQGK